MKRTMLPLLLCALLALAVQAPAWGNDAEGPAPDLAADALQSPADPPVIPHAVKSDQDGEECNACHRDGLKGAPPTSHPERLNCTQCHVQGAKQDGKKGKRGKK
ncbi:nitrate reductase cytochrome c-type subunit [Geomonas oryzisoli]|uniref:Nitrate reductase cytochrome c-type subunit n=1 Tax=Geomonas oryzisoli TaxID=2847992 RepID=A0ABX8J6L5_9BACT|nr:nitrate reductase cytochrome c-type subunit [Geomonas oryzisoli]QWV93224.1 nitrate reductase cytochrome c-type subunit [Geomonas oryzisoli]